MPRGFAQPRPAERSVAVWFSSYAKGNEDEPLVVARAELPAVAGQSVARLAVLHARRLLADPAVFEVIAHRGPSAQPERGDDVIARVCQEPFRGCLTLAPSADTK